MTGTAFNQNTFNAYTYNDRSEVVGGRKYQGSDPNDKTNPIPSYDYDYNYDPIGNRETFTESGAQTTYTANNLNQYEQISTLTDPVHDDDGNMTLMPSSSGDWTLEWNGENRLVVAESADTKLTFTYDYQGRRVEKKTYSTTDAGVTWTLDTDLRFIYDGWNLIYQQTTDNQQQTTTTKSFTWGLDLSQSLQGAGGVGGLLATRHPSTSGGGAGGEGSTYYACYDANGNISEYLAPDGTMQHLRIPRPGRHHSRPLRILPLRQTHRHRRNHPRSLHPPLLDQVPRHRDRTVLLRLPVLLPNWGRIGGYRCFIVLYNTQRRVKTALNSTPICDLF